MGKFGPVINVVVGAADHRPAQPFGGQVEFKIRAKGFAAFIEQAKIRLKLDFVLTLILIVGAVQVFRSLRRKLGRGAIG
ncbi:hypothetical protein [Roseovarius marisflavi]|uniref:hypothetical protein n=1 Tax=Roseovarius marisflavi TaxID=1054996 RepID=UPI000A049259|nr:hypothetical protein [Roseovarius marisflavi]